MKGLNPNGGATIPNDFYEAKKILPPLYLPNHKIYAFVNNCLLYYREYEDLESCIHCSEPHYKQTYSGQRKRVPPEERNIRVGLCTDGFSPFGPKSLVHNLYIFLKPLVDELNDLWTVGVDTYNAYKQQNFQLLVALMWTISDFLAYGMLLGWSTHGRLSCPYCMEKTGAFWLKEGEKHCWFDCHRPFLPDNHEYTNQSRAFKKGRTWSSEMQEERRSGEELFDMVSRLDPNVFGCSKQAEHRTHGYGQIHNWTKKSLFWELPYWPKLKIRHNIDFKHNEKNNSENFFFTMMDVKGKTKDTEASRKDLETHTYINSLYMTTKNRKPVKPKATYTLIQKQQEDVHSWLAKLKTPDGYASSFSRCTDSAKFTGLKSHDMHIHVQKLIPMFDDLPVINNASMEELLRDCEEANLAAFVNRQHIDEDAQSPANSDLHSIGASHHVEGDCSSSSKDEAGGELPIHQSSNPANCRACVPSSEIIQVP
ncbi:hypothetical protein LIER_38224 [Lithospermum erythrorhizon]|uniref:Uncharacterized protein n=1 Tax=Lithospermum erythrorhizon TaxID=34254 RepID=A0AAV3PWW8_LITER